ALQRFVPGTTVGKTFDPLAIPKHPTPPSTAAAPAPGPAEVAAPAPAPSPGPASTPHRRHPQSSIEVAAPAPAPAATPAPPAPAQSASPPPQATPTPAPAPEQPPAPAPPPPPAPAPTPPPAPQPTAAAAKASVGQGDTGAVVALGVPNNPAQNPQPDVDVTVGRNPVVGNAPPSDGTGVSVSVTPSVQTFETWVRATKRRLALEGSTVRPVNRAPVGHHFHFHFHTASARAAAFPGLQPQLETFSGRSVRSLWSGPPGGP